VETNDVIWPLDATGKPEATAPDGIEWHRGVLGFGVNGRDGLAVTPAFARSIRKGVS
jgi:hypothetical protein